MPPAAGAVVGPLRPACAELHAEFGDAVGAAEIVHALERRLVVVGIHAGAFRRNPPDRSDVGHLAHHQPGAAEREAAEMHQVPIVRRPIVGVVLAHRRDDDPIGQSEPAQRDGREQDACHRFKSPGTFLCKKHGHGAAYRRNATRACSHTEHYLARRRMYCKNPTRSAVT